VVLAAADERAHAPDASAGWWEAWQLDAASGDGTGLAVRLACAPALGVAWWWTHVLLPGAPGPVVVRDHEVGLPRQGLEVRADGLWGELTCEVPFEHWTYGLEAFGVKLDDPADSLRGEIGERLPVGLDVEWEVDPDGGVPYEYRGRTVTGYEQAGRVHGEILLGRSRFELDAVGLRSHEWGMPQSGVSARSAWFAAPATFTSYTVTEAGVDGYVVRGDSRRAISSVRTETRRGDDGYPVSVRHVIDDRAALDAEVLGLLAVPIAGAHGDRSTAVRGLCRADVDGEVAVGWSSWLDPE
jgi:hypothetical protein